MRPALGGLREKRMQGKRRHSAPTGSGFPSAPACGALRAGRWTLPRQKLGLESRSFFEELKIPQKIITQGKILKQKSAFGLCLFQPPSLAGDWELFSSVSLFTCMKQVSFPDASADPGLLCLGFQYHWEFSVCKNFSPWNISWKPDMNEPRPSLSLE